MLYDSRKEKLVNAFGTDNCLDSESWKKATFEDLTGSFTIYTDDIEFLYEANHCLEKEEEETTTGTIIIYADGIKADVYIDGTKVGTTDKSITLEQGTYTASIQKSGYVTQTLEIAINKKYNATKNITMVKEQEETVEVPITTPTSGANVQRTKTDPKLPSKLRIGDYNWFGFEVKNYGDTKWRGMVGIKLTGKDSNGTAISTFSYKGDETKLQTVTAGETKFLWVHCIVDSTFDAGTVTKTEMLLTETG